MAFIVAMSGAIIYFLESSAYTTLLGESHKYTKLLEITVAVIIIGCVAFWVGMKKAEQQNFNQ